MYFIFYSMQIEIKHMEIMGDLKVLHFGNTGEKSEQIQLQRNKGYSKPEQKLFVK